MNLQLLLIYLMCVGGFLFRVIVPYVLEWLEKKEPWSWEYLTMQLLGQIVSVITIYGTNFDELLLQLGNSGYAAAFIIGYFATDIGNMTRKANRAIRSN